MKNLAIVASMAITLPVAAQAAPILVDDFNVGLPALSVGPGESATQDFVDASILGGKRAISVAQVGGTGFVAAGAPSGSFFLDAGTGTAAFARTDYSASEFDLFDGTNDRFFVEYLSAGGPVTGTVIVSGVQVTKAVAANTTVEYLFSDFGGVDFNDVSFFSLELGTIDGGGAAVDTFRIGSAVSAIPLPAGGALLLTALGALALRRRKG